MAGKGDRLNWGGRIGRDFLVAAGKGRRRRCGTGALLSTRVIPDDRRSSGDPSLEDAACASCRERARPLHRTGRSRWLRSEQGLQTAARPGVTRVGRDVSRRVSSGNADTH